MPAAHSAAVAPHPYPQSPHGQQHKHKHTHDGYKQVANDIANHYTAYDLLYYPTVKQCPSHAYQTYSQRSAHHEVHYMVRLHSQDLFLHNDSNYFCNYCLNFKQDDYLWFCTKCSFCLCQPCDSLDQHHIELARQRREAESKAVDPISPYDQNVDSHGSAWNNPSNAAHSATQHTIDLCVNDALQYTEYTHQQPLPADHHQREKHNRHNHLCDCDVMSTQELQQMHARLYVAAQTNCARLYNRLSEDIKELYIWTQEQYSLILSELNVVPPYHIWYNDGQLNEPLRQLYLLYYKQSGEDTPEHGTDIPPAPQQWRLHRSAFVRFVKEQLAEDAANAKKQLAAEAARLRYHLSRPANEIPAAVIDEQLREYANFLIHIYGHTELENKTGYYYEGQLAVREVQRRLNALTLIQSEVDESDSYDKLEQKQLRANRSWLQWLCCCPTPHSHSELDEHDIHDQLEEQQRRANRTWWQWLVGVQPSVPTFKYTDGKDKKFNVPWTYQRFDARRKHVEFGLLPFRLVQASARRLGTAIAGDAVSWSGLIKYMVQLPLNFVTGIHFKVVAQNTNFEQLVGAPMWSMIILITVQMWSFLRCVQINHYWAAYAVCPIAFLLWVRWLRTRRGRPHHLRINLVMEIFNKPGKRRWFGMMSSIVFLLGGPALGYILYLIYYDDFAYVDDLTIHYLYNVEICTYFGACLLHLFVFSANNYIKSPGRALHRTATGVMSDLVKRTKADVGSSILSENIQRCTRRLASLSNTYQLRLLQELYAHQIDIVPLRVFVNTLKKHHEARYTHLDSHHQSTSKSAEHKKVDTSAKQLHPQQLLQHTRRQLSDEQVNAAKKKLRQVLRSELYGQAGLKAMLEDAAILSAPAATVLHELLDKSDAELIKSKNAVLNKALTGFVLLIAACHSFNPIVFHAYDSANPITVFSVAIALQSFLLIALSLHNINALFWAAYSDSQLLDNLTHLLDNYNAFSNRLPPIKLIDEHHVRTWRVMRMYCIQGLQCRAAEFSMLLTAPLVILAGFVAVIVASLIWSLGIFQLSLSAVLVTLIVDLLGSLVFIPPLYYMALCNKTLNDEHKSALKQQMCHIGGDVDHIQHLYDAIDAESDTAVCIAGVAVTFASLSTLPALIFTGIVSLASKVTG